MAVTVGKYIETYIDKTTGERRVRVHNGPAYASFALGEIEQLIRELRETLQQNPKK